jgi:hypothetical protein
MAGHLPLESERSFRDVETTPSSTSKKNTTQSLAQNTAKPSSLSTKTSPSPPSKTEITSYDSEKYLDCASFTQTLSQTTRVAGLPKAVGYVSTLDSKDMDIYVLLCKLDSKGNALLNLNIP